MVQPQPAGALAIAALLMFTTVLVAGARVASHRVAPRRRPAVLRGHRRMAAAAGGLALLHGVAALAGDRGAPVPGILFGVAAVVVAAVPALAWRLRRSLPRGAWVNGHRAGYAVVPLGVAHAWIIHPGPMAPIVEPLLYSLLFTGACATMLWRLAGARSEGRIPARP